MVDLMAHVWPPGTSGTLGSVRPSKIALAKDVGGGEGIAQLSEACCSSGSYGRALPVGVWGPAWPFTKKKKKKGEEVEFH
jgi:hypothetical protein